MSFTDHKITQFAHRVSDLPDQPTLPPDELKSRFDACPEELRQSLNAVCDDAARLEARVEGIVVDTFGDTIDKEMLSDELAAELDGKATQSALDSTADALDGRLDAVETALPQKCEVYFGTYTGDGNLTRIISLGYKPKLLYVCSENGYTYNSPLYYGGLAMDGVSAKGTDKTGKADLITIVDNGFRVRNSESIGGSGTFLAANLSETVYHYFALV